MPGITLTEEEVRKLTSCGNPDAAVLFLYRKAELPRETALAALHFTVPRMVGATDTLRQLGLWQEERPVHPTPERPQYTEEDLKREQQAGDGRFRNLVGEAQRRLGRTLSTEELKILLSFIDYLRLPTEVVGVLLYYCLERSRRRDSRAPSMRAIEKEAYRWADEGIDTLETASYYVQQQLLLHTRVQQLRQLLQIDQRRLTPAEEKYLVSWIRMGFRDDTIRMAYERTCLNTGALKWAYMNSILTSWHEQNLHTPEEILAGDAPRKPQPEQRRASAYQQHDAVPAVLFGAKQHYGRHYPNDAAVAQRRNSRHPKIQQRAGGQHPQAVQDDPIQVHACFAPFTMGTPGCSLRSIIIFEPSSASSTVAPNTKPTGWKIAILSAGRGAAKLAGPLAMAYSEPSIRP